MVIAGLEVVDPNKKGEAKTKNAVKIELVSSKKEEKNGKDYY